MEIQLCLASTMHTKTRPRVQQACGGCSQASRVDDPILMMQRALGNRYLQRILSPDMRGRVQRAPEEGQPEAAEKTAPAKQRKIPDATTVQEIAAIALAEAEGEHKFGTGE